VRLLELLRPFRVIVARRVTEEEQVTVEGFYSSQAKAETDLQRFLQVFRDHRKATNQEVVRATQQQLAALDTAIQAKGNEAHRLDEELEKTRIEVKRLNDLIRHGRNRLGLVQPVPNGPDTQSRA
jgi:septal ring factor EnvC (AmiA/AmiB activator)